MRCRRCLSTVSWFSLDVLFRIEWIRIRVVQKIVKIVNSENFCAIALSVSNICFAMFSARS